MNYRFLSILLLILTFCFFAHAVEIPKEIEKMGFTQDTLVTYHRNANEEIFIFLDENRKEYLGTVTFVYKDGVVTEYYKSDVRPKKDNKAKNKDR